jgi:hypothetical protein
MVAAGKALAFALLSLWLFPKVAPLLLLLRANRHLLVACAAVAVCVRWGRVLMFGVVAPHWAVLQLAERLWPVARPSDATGGGGALQPRELPRALKWAWLAFAVLLGSFVGALLASASPLAACLKLFSLLVGVARAALV